MINCQRAFTLIELLIVITLISILIAIAIPSLHSVTEKSTNQILQSQLKLAIQFARSEAREQYANIGIRFSRESLLVFIDDHPDNATANNQHILSVIDLSLASGHLYMRSYPYSRQYFQFRPDQWKDSDNGSIWYCKPHQSKPEWVMLVSFAGSTRVQYPTRNGELNDEKGKPYPCYQQVTAEG